MLNAKDFYSFDKVYSYNAVYNFIPGGRGIGKTYGAKKKAISAAIKRGDQFIYLRRYSKELSVSRDTFFADIAHEFPKWEFRIHGSKAQMTEAINLDKLPDDQKQKAIKGRVWQTIGYFVALSTAQSQKSVAFPKVKLIIYDEFIIEKGAIHYLPNETTVFNNFYNTVDRWKDKTRVLFLANAVSITNPYFIEYRIRPDDVDESGIITMANGFICCHFPDSEAFGNKVKQTRFGKFINGSDYADYAVGNQFSDNHDGMIEIKDPNSKYLFTLETMLGTFAVWKNFSSGEWYVQRKLPKDENVLTLLPERMGEGKILVTFNDKIIGAMRTAFNRDMVNFDEQSTRNAFIEVYKRK